MSHYDPDPAAIPTGTAFIRQLSQRDLGLEVPVNYVTAPGISLTPACFAHDLYEDGRAVKCFSNLLAVGFQRFEVDMYWDVSRKLWSLCPVELGNAQFGTSTTSTASTSAATAKIHNLNVRAWLGLQERREASPATSSLSSSQRSASATLVSMPTAVGTITGAVPSATSLIGSGSLLHVGPYSCSSSLDITTLTAVLSEHLYTTQYTLNATLKYVILNLHVAAPASDPTGSAQTPDKADLPKGKNILSNVISSQLAQYLYTPTDLQHERSDLNASDSWSGGERRYESDTAYFEVQGSGDHYSTINGWPGAGFIEMSMAKRLFTGYGRVDPQLDGYNFSADALTMFRTAYLQKATSVTLSSDGIVEDGCFYDAGEYSISSVNNSWATAAYNNSVTGSLQPLIDAVANLTNCGVSPILNATLNDETADQNFSPYLDFAQSMIWCWAPGQPVNAAGGSDDSSTNDRCAVLNASSARLQTANCGQRYRSACRKSGSAYEWSISNSAATYTNAQLVCPKNTVFDAPRTALEQRYLLHKWLAERKAGNELLWINLNDLDAKSCWVVGQNSTCPYLPRSDDDQQIIVPTVAAVIVFVLAALTILVKCAANRQQSKRRRRRGDNGWDYEGVPS